MDCRSCTPTSFRDLTQSLSKDYLPLVGDPLGILPKAIQKYAAHPFGFCISCQRLQASLRVSLKYKSPSLS
jgi:hypothetical protein